MNYYLLTFNNNYADEFDVLSQEVMDQNEYDHWSNAKAGRLNEHYEDELKELDNKRKAYERWQAMYNAMYKRYYKSKTWDQLTLEDRKAIAKWQTENPSPPYVGTWETPKKVSPRIVAYLGNYGDCFEEDYTDLPYMKDYVTQGVVKVQSCTKTFYHEFKALELNTQSVCNVFSVDEWDEDEDKNEED